MILFTMVLYSNRIFFRWVVLRAFGTGAYFRVAAGKGTGTGRGSDLRFAIAPPGATSDSILNPYVDVYFRTAASLASAFGIGGSMALASGAGESALPVAAAGDASSSLAVLREEVAALKAEIELLKQQREEIISLQASLQAMREQLQHKN